MRRAMVTVHGTCWLLFTEMHPKMPPWIATGVLNTRVTNVAATLVRTKLVLGRVPALGPWAFRKLAGDAAGRMSGVMVTTVEPPVPVKVTEMGEPMAKLSGTKPLPALPREAELKFSAAAAWEQGIHRNTTRLACRGTPVDAMLEQRVLKVWEVMELATTHSC